MNDDSFQKQREQIQQDPERAANIEREKARLEEASQKAEAFDPALADELIFVIGELGVVVDPDRRLLVVSVPKVIDWDNDVQLTNAAASLIPAVADAMERRKEAK